MTGTLQTVPKLPRFVPCKSIESKYSINLYSGKILRESTVDWISQCPFSWFVTLTFPYRTVTKHAAINNLRRFVHRFNRAMYGKHRANKYPSQCLSLVAFIEKNFEQGFHFHCLVQPPSSIPSRPSAQYMPLFRAIWEETGGSYQQFDQQEIKSSFDVRKIAHYATKKMYSNKDCVILDWFHKRAD